MITFILLIISIMAQQRTSVNTCTNEKTIFKLDIRQRVKNISPTSTVRDIDASALCQEAYLYDYIWLTQLWTPGKFNYDDVNGAPQQSKDYRVLQSIKEYKMDPQLGQLADLYLLQTNIKNRCPHMKFLGEFSFYASYDSYLLSNVSRFLRRPANDSFNIYDSRYDDENYVWAFNDQMKTIPYTVQWNYFDPTVVDDMKDIIYRVIIEQHKLDGIVFLQPSLGLYSVLNQIYQAEIAFYGSTSFLQDFYQSFGLKENSQSLFFMGGEDNLNQKIILQNYLQQIYGSPLSNVWANFNYTFVQGNSYATIVDAKNVQGNNPSNQGRAQVQSPPSSPTCMSYQITNSGNIEAGVYNTLNYRYTLVYNGSLRYNGEPFLDDSYCYNYYEKDIIEIQYDPSVEQFIFKKYSIDYTNFQQLSMMIPGGYNNIYSLVHVQDSSSIQIKFPCQFSQKYKHPNLAIQNPQKVTLTSSNSQRLLYYAQIWPTVNQNENDVTLNFQIQSFNQTMAIGMCNQEVVNKNNNVYTLTHPDASGVYMWFSHGCINIKQIDYWHNSSTYWNNREIWFSYGVGDTVTVTYTNSNTSISYYKNSEFILAVAIDKVKNLNFCTCLEGIGNRQFVILINIIQDNMISFIINQIFDSFDS